MGKWTEENRNKAIDMLKNGGNEYDIAKLFNMSVYSVDILKYKYITVNEERIKCEICGNEFAQITGRHLKEKHNIKIEDYKKMFPNSPTMTEKRKKYYRNFIHPNKGKTYDEIYGKEEGDKKRNIISKKQIGRKCPPLAGTGITGTRKDTGLFARSTYEANLDRIFKYENKKIEGEFSELNKRISLIGDNGIEKTYQPDRLDVDGLFYKGALLEVKGYMYIDDWKKICLFRKQFPDKKLLVISENEKYFDIDYRILEKKYKPLIPLWETEFQNYKTRPDLYNINYVPTELENYIKDNFTNRIHKSIIDEHKKFIASRAIAYSSVSQGKNINIESVNLLNITDRRNNNFTYDLNYNYELWEVKAFDGRKLYVTNCFKNVVFYTYEENDEKIKKAFSFFADKPNNNLNHGPICKNINGNIFDQLSDYEKYFYKLISNKIKNKKEYGNIIGLKLLKVKNSRSFNINNYEDWEVLIENNGTIKKYSAKNYGFMFQYLTLKEDIIQNTTVRSKL